MSNETKSTKPLMRTGCDLLDLLIGGEKGVFGIPFGNIINIVGDKSSGKSFFKNEILAANYYRYRDQFRWISDDTECGDTFNTNKLYGFNLSSQGHHLGKVEFDHSTTVEELDAHVTLFLETLNPGNCAIYAVDSLDGLSDAADEDEKDLRVNQMKAGKEIEVAGSYNMGKQKFLSKFFRTQESAVMKKNCSIVIVSQIRDKIGAMGMGQKWSVSGGHALEFFCHTRIFLTTIKKIKVGDRTIGAVVRAKTTKSKTPRPFREVTYTVYFDRGIDNVGSNIDFLYNLRGKDGELLSTANSICWGNHKPTLESVKSWLEEKGWMDSYKDYAAEKLGQRRLNLEVATEWANANHPDEWKDYFGVILTRDQLRDLCQHNTQERKLLRQKVREKWEEIEDNAVAQIGFNKVYDIDD